MPLDRSVTGITLKTIATPGTLAIPLPGKARLEQEELSNYLEYQILVLPFLLGAPPLPTKEDYADFIS